MYRFYLNNIEDDYHFMELARVFFPDEGFETIAYTGKPVAHLLGQDSYFVNERGSDDREEVKREFYELLSDITGTRPPWGTLTGVRPLKPALEICKDSSIANMKQVISERYLLSSQKASLIADIADYQMQNVHGIPWKKVSVYIGIPFCPTRCSYCSFASNVAPDEDRSIYLNDLLKEICYAGGLAEKNATELESIYIGGGTPTTLSSDQLEALISATADAFHIDPAGLEFTVEAGRPDTITREKLEALKRLGVSRISINPQSMKDKTLKLIGRDHSSDDIREGFRTARSVGINLINADLIAGLPEEDVSDFEASLREVIEFGAENITIHTLSVKRGSRLKENDPDYYRKNAGTVSAMLDLSRQMLSSAGYRPYYIYRQKHQIGALENVGWCMPGTHSIYNIRIMEDKQTVMGLGAGAVGKVYHQAEDRLERIANVSNYKIYSERFDDMISRKNDYYK